MSFLKLFTERASAYKDNCYLISNIFLPLTRKISDLLGGGKNKTAFHTTSLEYLPNLKKIKGDKAISAFTKGLNSVVRNVNVKPDVLVKLEGNVLLEIHKDAFTHLDKSGKRWVSLDSISNDSKKLTFIHYAFINKTIGFINDNYNLGVTKEDLRDNSFCKKFDTLTAKQKKEVLDFHIKHIEALMNNTMYLNMIKEFLDSNESKYSHNELVINNFKILGVYSIEVGKYQFDHSLARYQIEKMGYNYLGHISKDEFNKVSIETY